MKKTAIIFSFLFFAMYINAQTPVANAGPDKLFCGTSGYLSAVPSVGTGVWTSITPDHITFSNPADPNTEVISDIITTGDPYHPYFYLVWTETSGAETDSDTVKVTFARIPSSDMDIIPPKCFGEPASIFAYEDSLHQYIWNFYDGLIDYAYPDNPWGGNYGNRVYWTNENTFHQVSLISTNSYGCQSVITIDTAFEPPVPVFDITIIPDTCSSGKGAIIFGNTNENYFFWINHETGPEPGPIIEVHNLPAGTYDIRASYLTPNITHYSYYINTFGTANCIDTIHVPVDSHNLFEMSCPADMEITSHDVFSLNTLSGIFPSNGTFFIEGEEVTTFNSYNFDNGTHNVTYLYYDENTDCQGECDFNITVNINSGITQSESDTFSIYPNPASEKFSVAYDAPETIKISVIDMNGKTAIEIPDYHGQEISTGNMNCGIYFIKIQSPQISVCKKLFIK